MGKYILLVCASMLLLKFTSVNTQYSDETESTVPLSRFSCHGRGSGYYADVDTGCQVYHMCDGLGRQFSYKCPNMTLFQQRMLICDHWYMVNCSMSEKDYNANLLIGQRDKPFVSDDEMRFRTPRPDILSAPPYNPYLDLLKESESKFPHPNSIVGLAEVIGKGKNNRVETGKQNYRPPTAWFTGTKRRTKANTPINFQTDAKTTTIAKTTTNINTEAETNINTNTEAETTINTNTEAKTTTNTNTEAKTTTNTNTEAKTTTKPKTIANRKSTKNVVLFDQAAESPGSSFGPILNINFSQNNLKQKVSPPSIELVPPPAPTTETSESVEDTSVEPTQANVFKFIKRFDPTAPDVQETAMTKSEIISLNDHLPPAPETSEEDRIPRKNKIFGTTVKPFPTIKTFGEEYNIVNTKFDKLDAEEKEKDEISFEFLVPEPVKTLRPPKINRANIAPTTVGPPIYYEWKWAVPAFNLSPPKVGNTSKTTPLTTHQTRSVFPQGQSPFRGVTRPIPKTTTPEPSKVEYNISSYFVPDYVFPLDKEHPGYEGDEAETSFQVKIARPGVRSFGENPDCPQCHPAYLNEGSCEPCIVKR